LLYLSPTEIAVMKGISEISNRAYPIEALMENYGFSPENVNETLAKTVNDIYYRTYGQGVDTLDASDIAMLESIIHICPQAGGNAVYSARALYRTVNDTMVYNDSLVCIQAGYFREIKEEWEKNNPIYNAQDKLRLMVYPNPFTNELFWRIIGEHGEGTIVIKDMMGKSLREERVSAGKQEGLLNLSELSGGIYLIQYRDIKNISTKKIIKQ
jgi:hypothetical protein